MEQIDWRDFAIAASETSRVVATHLLFPGLHAK
jgi:hypothetical protein